MPKSFKNQRVTPTIEEHLKRLIIVALFSDDELMEMFVLKGGSALDIVHGVSKRSSIDIDISMESDFDADSLPEIRRTIEKNLQNTLRPEGFEPFDLTLEPKPEKIPPEATGFWGGYSLQFKIIETARFQELIDNLESLRRNALLLSGKGTFQVDISKREYTSTKISWQLGGIRIYAYSPAMMAAEKLRAICQQMESYCRHVGKHPTPRARDFVDIQALITERDVNLVNDDGRELVRRVFAAKEVPLSLLGEVSQQRNFHRLDFEAVRDTVKPNTVLEDFDFYFEFVLDVCGQLKPLWSI